MSEGKLNKRALYTYGVADFGFSMMVSMETYYFANFLTDKAQFPASIYGPIMNITSFIDIACALLAGIILQRITLRPWGKYRSWLLLAPPIVALLFILQYTKIGGDGSAAAIIMFGFISSHLLWNIFYTANVSLIGKMSNVPAERTMMSASRGHGQTIATLLFSFIALPIIDFIGKQTNVVSGYTWTVAIFSLVMILCQWYNFNLTKGHDTYEEAGAAGSESKQSLGETVGLVFKNPQLLILILLEIFRNTGVFIISAFGIYYFKYVLNDAPNFNLYLTITNLAGFAGALAGGPLAVKFGKRKAYMGALFISAICLVIARMVGSTFLTFTVVLCFVQFTYRIAMGLVTAMFSDTVIYSEWKTGKHNRAFIMSLLTFPIKVGVFIRSMIVAVGLGFIGYIANEAQSPATVSGFKTIITILPAAAFVLAALCVLLFYKLDDKRVLELQGEISARK